MLLFLSLFLCVLLRALVSQNLFGSFSHICSAAWYQLFLVSLVKPGLMEGILARIQKTWD